MALRRITVCLTARQVFLALVTPQLLMTSQAMPQQPQDFFEEDASVDDVTANNVTSSFVADIPEFLSTNRSLRATLGGNLTLSCQVNKLSGYQIIWYKRRTPNEEWKVLRIGQTPVVIKKNDSRFSFESNSTILRISDVELDDQGLYKCEVAVANTPKLYLDVQVSKSSESMARSGDANAAAAASATAAAVMSTLMSISVTLLVWAL